MKLLWLKIIAIIVLLGGSYLFYTFGVNEIEFEVPDAISFEEVKERVTEMASEVENVEIVEDVESVEIVEDVETRLETDIRHSNLDIPTEVNLDVPFTSQAPFANWDEVHEEACEEASVLMVHAFYEGEVKGEIDPNIAEDVLQDMVESERMIFGFFEDTTAEQTANFAKIYYGYERVDVIENPTIEDLKLHLVDGRPVIVPAAGRILSNPFFSGIGPIYHMLVLKGYTEHGFITNDPGTRRGADWVYNHDHLMSSIHDWVVPEGIEERQSDIMDSARKVIVIYPN